MMSPYIAPLAGLAIGAVLGYLVRRARLCSFGAIEDALEGGDYRRLKAFGLALAVALAGTQALIFSGALIPTETPYIPARSAVLSIAVGGVMFGLGMALVGTCGFGSLVRLGGGDLRAFVVILTYAAAAYAFLRGILAPFRIGVIESVSVAMPGSHPAGLIETMEGLSGLSLRLVVVIAIVGVLLTLVVSDRRLRKAPRLLAAGVALGCGVVTGWLVTAVLADEFSPARVQSLTFVAPVARGVFSIVLGGRDWLDFGVMSVAGVVGGAFAAALAMDEFRWEAFDDHHEMRRHLIGAVLMGAGGVLAGGCTIGQGLSAASLGAVSWPIAIIGILVGARIGVAILVEGTPTHLIRELWSRWLGRRAG
jgi:uncharacterized membrane protein YedE/YeeE